MGTLSVIIVNWNAGQALDDCLAALFASKPWGGALEVLLVDNGSTDGSQARAAQDYPALTVIQNAGNLGFSRAVNQGLRQTAGELTLLLNPDVVLNPGAAPLLVDFMAQHPEAAVVGPRLLNHDGTVQGSARRDPSPWTGLFGRSTPLTRFFPDNPVSRREQPGLRSEGADPVEVDWVSGACLLVRRAAYESAGLLDERFFLFWEDADWCLRFRRARWRVYYLPSALGTHQVGVSCAQRPIRSAIDFHRSAYRFYRKHHPHSPLHPMMMLLTCGLLVNLGIRLLQTVLTRR